MEQNLNKSEHQELQPHEIPLYQLDVSSDLDISTDQIDRLNLILRFVSQAPTYLMDKHKESSDMLGTDTPDSQKMSEFAKEARRFSSIDGTLLMHKDNADEDKQLTQILKKGLDIFFKNRNYDASSTQATSIKINNKEHLDLVEKQIYLAKHDVSSSLRAAITSLEFYALDPDPSFVSNARDVLQNIPRDIDAAREVLNPEFSNTQTLTYGQVMDIFRSYENPTSTVSVRFPDSLSSTDAVINTSPILLQRFWRNILINAEEAYNDRDIKENRTITVSIRSKGDKDEFRFQDQAGGFEETFIKRGFVRGKRGSKGTVGTGVAMRTLNDLFKHQGIDIELENMDNGEDKAKSGVVILRFPHKTS